MTCDELRQRVIDAKRVRNIAIGANGTAENEGRALPYSESTLMELRGAVHMAALAAREAGCDIDDLVGPNVGDPDASL